MVSLYCIRVWILDCMKSKIRSYFNIHVVDAGVEYSTAEKHEVQKQHLDGVSSDVTTSNTRLD